MKKLLFIILAVFSVNAALMAQSNFTISYPISFATGDMGDFITKTSWRGLSFDYRYHVTPNAAVGLNSAWITFYEEMNSETYTSDNVSLHGKQFRYSNNVPIVATGAYFFQPEARTNPFVSVGIGTMYTRRNTDMNLYTLEQEAWNFLVQPEVGVQITIGEGSAACLSLKYNHGFKAGSELTDDQTFLSLNVGFSFF